MFFGMTPIPGVPKQVKQRICSQFSRFFPEKDLILPENMRFLIP